MISYTPHRQDCEFMQQAKRIIQRNAVSRKAPVGKQEKKEQQKR